MSLEDYAVHIAPRGGKIDLIVDEVAAARDAAFQKRIEYSRAKGAIGINHNEHGVNGLFFASEDKIPDGWAKVSKTSDGILTQPKAKDRTKAARQQLKALRDELCALPRMPGSWEFTHRIGGSQTMAGPAPGGRGYRLLSCWYERIGDVTFVMTPWHSKTDTGESMDESPASENDRIAFLPEGCERVPLSRYYAIKEAQPAPASEA